MVEYSQSLDSLFYSLSDSTRRDILDRLTKNDLSVSEIALPYDMTLAAISKHLKVLERAKLIIRRKQGKQHIFQLYPPAFADASEYISYYTNFWESNLDSLKSYLERNNDG